jgi:CRP-like cAMP-binding protein
MSVSIGTLKKFVLFTGENLRAGEIVYSGQPVERHVTTMLETSYRTRMKEYLPGELILDQEVEAPNIIALVQGVIHQRQRKDGKERHAEFIRPNEPTNVSFGISSLRRVSGAYAFGGETIVVFIHRDDFVNAMQLSRAFTLNTMAYMSTRLIIYLKHSDWIEEMKKEPDRVIARFLLEAHDALRSGENTDESQVLIRLQQEQLAEYVSVNFDRVRKIIIPTWKRKGIIDYQRNGFRILNRGALKRILGPSESQDLYSDEDEVASEKTSPG